MTRHAALLVTMSVVLSPVRGLGSQPCAPSDVATVFVSPDSPAPDRPLRFMAVSERPLDASLAVVGPGGREAARTDERRAGPPYWWAVEVAAPEQGVYRGRLGDACAAARVGES